MGLHRHTIKNSLGILTLLSLLASPFFVSASTTDGTIDATNKYAWSQNIGWINFGVSQGNVHVTDSQLTGYTWSENTGWINLNPSPSNFVHNDSEGNLSGYAWGEGIGYIDFTGVTIDSTGYFHGYASSTISGKISFNCANSSSCGSSNFVVQTDWRPASSRTPTPTPSSGGGGGPLSVGSFPASLPASPPLLINNGATTTSSSVVQLSLSGNDVANMMVSNSYDFSGAAWEPYSKTKSWQLTPGEGVKTMYVQFQNASGATSSIIFQSITLFNAGQTTSVAINTNPPSLILPATNTCAPYLTKYIKFGRNNDPAEILKLQKFLQNYGTPDLALTSVYDAQTRVAVLKFQTAYAADILGPWNTDTPTGYVFKTTLKKINQLYCAQKSMSAPSLPSVATSSPARISAMTCPYFTKHLIFNSQNSEVIKVQEFLKTQGLLSTGHLDGSVVDRQTVDAIKLFQNKYAAEILASNALSSPTGYWLASSLKEANILVGCK